MAALRAVIQPSPDTDGDIDEDTEKYIDINTAIAPAIAGELVSCIAV